MSTESPYATERDCEARHLRNNADTLEAKTIALAAKNRADLNAYRLTALSGEDGKNGVVGENRTDVADHERRLRLLETSMTRNDVRLALYSSGFALVGSALVSLVVHFLTQ